MHWERIRYWQWLVIAVFIGLGVARVRQGYVDDAIKDLGESLNGQAQFEESLLRDVQGHRQFENVIVTPERLPDGRGGFHFVHVVRGMYWDGRLNSPTGAQQITWSPAFFVADVPYHPQLNLALLGPQGEQINRRLSAIRNPTVLDFLSAVQQTHAVHYRYEWWRGSAYAPWLWLGGCTLIIGLALPRVINLSVYGTFTRPKIEKRPAIAPSYRTTHSGPTMTNQDLAQLSHLERGMEQQLHAATAETVLLAAATESPVRALTSTPLEQAAQSHADQKDFGAEKDDFYPTERHGRR
jgi:hypothetical protein